MAQQNVEHFAKIIHGLGVPKEGAMKHYDLRLASFKTFPRSVPQSALKLTNAGFYYTGKDDEVQCFDCGLNLNDWSPNDDPFEKHKRCSPNCPYINTAADNVPLARITPIAWDHLLQTAATPFNRLKEKKSYMIHEVLRIGSFKGFPTSVPQSAVKLQSGGFYYTGKDDEVECFNCPLKVKDWKPEDDPFEVHKLKSPKCPFINKVLIDSSSPSVMEGATGGADAGAGSLIRANDKEQLPLSYKESDSVVYNSDLWQEAQRETVLEIGGRFPQATTIADKSKKEKNRDEANNVLGIPELVTDLDEELEQMENADKSNSEQGPQVIVSENGCSHSVPGRVNKPAISLKSSGEIPSDSVVLAYARNIPSPTNNYAGVTQVVQSKQQGSHGEQNKQDKMLALHREHTRLREKRICKNCHQYLSSVVFRPCRHLVSCGDCAVSLKNCPLADCGAGIVKCLQVQFETFDSFILEYLATP